MASSKTLDEEAVEALLAEARRMRSMEGDFGSAAWTPKPVSKVPNKRFVRNIIHHSVQHNARTKSDKSHSSTQVTNVAQVSESPVCEKKCSNGHGRHNHCLNIGKKKSKSKSEMFRNNSLKLKNKKRHCSTDRSPDFQKHIKLSGKT